MRWSALVIGVALVAFAVLLRMRGVLLPVEMTLASDLFGKVGLVMLAVWFAWPAIEALWNTPSGAALAGAFGLSAILFAYQPKTLLFTGPFLAVSVLLALLVNWVRKGR